VLTLSVPVRVTLMKSACSYIRWKIYSIKAVREVEESVGRSNKVVELS